MLGALVSLVTGYLEARAIKGALDEAGLYADRWFRLVAAVLMTSYVGFPGMVGLVASAALASGDSPWLALGKGIIGALLVVPLVVYNLWVRSDLTKGIPIALASQLAAAAVNQNVVVTERR